MVDKKIESIKLKMEGLEKTSEQYKMYEEVLSELMKLKPVKITVAEDGICESCQ